MHLIDKTYCGLPWKAGGRSRHGLDCAGLSQIWLNEQMGLQFEAPASGSDPDVEKSLGLQLNQKFSSAILERGDQVFFRSKETKKVCHVATYLGDNRYLHIMRGLTSRIETGTRLMERIGLEPVGWISAKETERLCLALKDPALGTWTALILLVISLALSAASSFLLRPKLGQFRNQTGRYGFDALATQTNSELPLCDILGRVTVAGNSPYQSLIDRSQTVTDDTQQKANYVVIICSGTFSGFDNGGIGTTINGIAYDNSYFYAASPNRGVYLNPGQNKADCVTGTIGTDNNRSSMSVWPGDNIIVVPHDIRAEYERDFPIYGFSGCAYMVFRLINSEKFSGFNLNTTVDGRLFRQFDQNGFIVVSDTAFNAQPADGVLTRFKLLYEDIEDVSGVTVNGTAYTEISASNQTGNVYSVNRLKGYIEFLTPPPASATLTANYTHHYLLWSNNPAVHLVYLLTDKIRGKGLHASKINWGSANDLQTFCNQTVTWINDSGVNTGPRYVSNYAVDSRKPIQEHIQAVLDSCYAYLFLSGGQFYLKARTADTAVMDFDADNIIAGSFSSEMIDRSAIANRIHVFFRSTQTYNVETEIIRDDATDQRARSSRAGNNGVVEQVLHVPAIDDQAQAERYGEQILRENVATRWTCQFTTNIQGLPLQPGDIITVTHPSRPTWQQKLFRIEQMTYDANDQLVISASEYFDGSYI